MRSAGCSEYRPIALDCSHTPIGMCSGERVIARGAVISFHCESALLTAAKEPTRDVAAHAAEADDTDLHVPLASLLSCGHCAA